MRLALGACRIVLALLAVCGCGGSPSSALAPTSGSDPVRLPARFRRLTNAEYERALDDVVGAPEHVADRLPPDVRQDGYTPNAEQAVVSAWESAVDAVAHDVAHRAVVERLEKLAPCAKSDTPDCRAEFVDTLGARAWRRPIDAADHATLLAAFDAAAGKDALPGGFAKGAEAVLVALLESPSLVYLTELGAGGPPGSVVKLTPYEIASLLSFTLRGGPPDGALLQAAASGALILPDAREAQARRLLAMSDTRFQFRRFVLEWLEVDGLGRTVKSAELYPGYDAVKSHMLDETTAFADEVMVYAGGSVAALLDARFASVDPDMARFYGLKTWGTRASLAGTRRAGVLQQASFLAAHAHEDGTSPVKRGDFVLRRLLCVRVPRPAEVGIETVFPPPSTAKTTRERFAVHSENPGCRACHERLDALGFTFEAFDAAGALRAKDNGRPVDTSARVDVGGETETFGDSFDLADWLAKNPDVGECYKRQAFRYFTGQSDPRVESELVALAGAAARPRDRTTNLFEDLIDYVRSDLFVEREVRP
ncbi:MAG TPA: DUF1592 domain-containing protein [Polyangiaceae bacterium]